MDQLVNEDTSHATIAIRTDVGWVGTLQGFNIIVLITPDPGWHIYWKNAGASGSPTEIEVSAPDGFVVGDPLFPRPTVFQEAVGQTYGYNKPVAIFIPITAPKVLQDGQVSFEVTTSWLACKKICVMGEQKNTLEVSTSALQQGPFHRDIQLSRWVKALPQPLENLEGGASVLVGDTLHVSGETEQRPIRFLGVERKGIQFGIPSQIIVKNGLFRLPIPITLDYSEAEGNIVIIEGILLFGRKTDDPSYVVQLTVDSQSHQNKNRGKKP